MLVAGISTGSVKVQAALTDKLWKVRDAVCVHAFKNIHV